MGGLSLPIVGWVVVFYLSPFAWSVGLFFRIISHYVPIEWLVLGPTCFVIWLPGIVLPVLGVGSIFFLSLFLRNAHPGVLLQFVLADSLQ